MMTVAIAVIGALCCDSMRGSTVTWVVADHSGYRSGVQGKLRDVQHTHATECVFLKHCSTMDLCDLRQSKL